MDDVHNPQKGRRVHFEVDGKERELYTIGALAAALNRDPATIRNYERQGLLRNAPLIEQTGGISTRRRYYPRELIEALAKVAENERFGRRRPSGGFRRQREAFSNAFDEVMAALITEPKALTDPPSARGIDDGRDSMI